MSFVKYITNDYSGYNALPNLLNYCEYDLDCYLEKAERIYKFVFRLNSLSNDSLVYEFNKLKEITDQSYGRQLEHFVISIYREDMMDKNRMVSARMIVNSIGEFMVNRGHQCVAYIHEKFDGNIHIHVIINNINFMTGNRLTNIKGFTNELTYLLRDGYPYLLWEKPKYGNMKIYSKSKKIMN